MPMGYRMPAPYVHGYDNNPTLRPGKEISAFGNAGYRFGQHWAVIGYLDSFRFSKSNEVTLTVGGMSQAIAYQPASDRRRQPPKQTR